MRAARVTAAHLAGIAELEALAFAEPWSESALALLLTDRAFGLVCLDDADSPIAYVGVLTVLDEGQITNVVTHPDHRRRGLADCLLDALLGEARARGLTTLSLEVRESNAAAVALYEKHGFFVAGKRNNFYKNPREHGLVMLCNLSCR